MNPYSVGVVYHAMRLLYLRKKKFFTMLGMLVAIMIGMYVFLLEAPHSFKTHSSIKIPELSSATTVAELLYEQQYIKNPFIFRAISKVLGCSTSLKHGVYHFSQRENVITLVIRICTGDKGSTSLRVFIPEGATSYEIRDMLAPQLPNFNANAFYERARKSEGMLFPDTYFISPEADEDEVYDLLIENFEAKIGTLDAELQSFERPLSEVLTFASILEKEGRTLEEKRMIAGVLWRRIAIGMPLQVDAVFGYIKESDTYHPSGTDLEIDSLYNTYKHRGLPPGPISNPSLESILASITPTKHSYVYYLTGTDGITRFAETFDEHKRNKFLYLK